VRRAEMEGFIRFWQHIPENLDPYILEIGSFRLGWYGLMYVVAFGVVYLMCLYRIRYEGFSYGKELLQDLFVWVVLGLIIGARLGYVIFYNPGYYLAHPMEIFLPVSFEGGVRFTGISGMSYHGGLIGCVSAGIWFLKRRKMDIWPFADFIFPGGPLGYTFGRIGNFINGELYGRATDAPWGMYFPQDPTGVLRHPSQLYEAFFEGIVLFVILWLWRKRFPFPGFSLALYVMGYGTVRFFIEFVRQPDAHLGTVLGPFSMGQVLCFAMIAAGALLALWLRARARKV
jgi:phosphatidylglycerol:prolipoprotein diacylglycerol transferase